MSIVRPKVTEDYGEKTELGGRHCADKSTLTGVRNSGKIVANFSIFTLV